MAAIGIIGAGSWGIALSWLLHNNGHQVTVWSAIGAEIRSLEQTRKLKTLPDLTLPAEMGFTESLKDAMDKKDILVLAVPSIYVRQTSKSMRPYCKDGQVIVNVAKGIEEETLMTLSEIISQELPAANVAVLSGPSHAEEVSRGLPTTCVVGAQDQRTAEWIQNLFMSEVFRVYTSPDILGIEIGGALKNVIALAAGIADGLGYGDNTKAALITRGIYEIGRLGMAMGGKFQTFCGLSGIGDLIVTCASMHSRNRKAGMLIGKGNTMQEAMDQVQMVVEGVYSAKAGLALSKKYEIPMPIIEQVNQVLFEDRPAGEAVMELMLRDKTIESTDVEWNLP